MKIENINLIKCVNILDLLYVISGYSVVGGRPVNGILESGFVFAFVYIYSNSDFQIMDTNSDLYLIFWII